MVFDLVELSTDMLAVSMIEQLSQFCPFVMSQQPRIRILCLHGWCSNAGHLEGSLKSLQNRIADATTPIELHFLQAPISMPIPDAARKKAFELGRSFDQIQRCTWWDASDDGKEYRGWRDSVTYIQNFMESSGPYHGILGFSQGAAMTAILCASLPKVEKCELKFAIMIGGFPPRDTDIQALMKESHALQQIPSLHAIGETDEIVKPKISRLLAQSFHSPSILIHPGGHDIPLTRDYGDDFIDFILQNSK